jgi:hypothetical protein
VWRHSFYFHLIFSIKNSLASDADVADIPTAAAPHPFGQSLAGTVQLLPSSVSVDGWLRGSEGICSATSSVWSC